MIDDLLKRICLRLSSSGYPGLRRVQVKLEQDKVVLQGRLARFHEKQLATELTRHVAGVHDVDNQIEVETRQPSSGLSSSMIVK